MRGSSTIMETISKQEMTIFINQHLPSSHQPSHQQNNENKSVSSSTTISLNQPLLMSSRLKIPDVRW